MSDMYGNYEGERVTGTQPGASQPPYPPPPPAMLGYYGVPPSQPLYSSQPGPPPGYAYLPPPPGYPVAMSKPLYPAQPPMVYVAPGYALLPSARPGKPEPISVAVEAICALFGIYGIGWLMSGRTGVGLGLLFGGLAWIAIVVIGSLITGGLGCICLGPLHLLFIVASTITLAMQGS